MSQTFTITIQGGGTATTATIGSGTTNAAADLTALGQVLGLLDQLIADWTTNYNAAPSTWRAQGGGAGAVTGSNSARGLQSRLQAQVAALVPLCQG